MSTSTAADVTSIIDPSTVRSLRVVGDVVTPLIGAEATNETFELFTADGPEGSGPPPHSHPWQESMVILDGELDVLIGDDWSRARTGDAVHVPAGVTHAYRIATGTAKFMVVTTGAGAGRFFVDMDASVSDPTDLPAMIEVAKRNGLSSPLF